MNPQILLNRGYFEDYASCYRQWLDAYAEIAEKHPELKEATRQLSERMERIYNLAISDGRALSGLPDDTCFGLYAERENKYYQATESVRNSLEGDFPCGTESEMVFARNFFTIREIAYIQLGLASEIDPDDYGVVQRGKFYAAGSLFSSEKDENNVRYGRKGYINESLGKIKEALDAYRLVTSYIASSRIDDLTEQLPFWKR